MATPKTGMHEKLDVNVHSMAGAFQFVGDLRTWKENIDHIGWKTYSRGYGYDEPAAQERFNALKADSVRGHPVLFNEFQQMRFRIMELCASDKERIGWCGDPVSVRLSARNCEQRYGYVWRWTAQGECLWKSDDTNADAISDSSPQNIVSPSQRSRPKQPSAIAQRVSSKPSPTAQLPTPAASPSAPQVSDVDVPFGLSVWAVVIHNNSVTDFFTESGISQIVTATSIAGRFFDTKDGGNALVNPEYESEVLDSARNLRIIVDKRLDEKDGRVKLFVTPYFRYHELRLTRAAANVKVRRKCMFVMKGNEDVSVAENILRKYCNISEVMT